MPGLILFRRRWAIGSDDFVFSSLGEALLRFSWLAALAIIYAAHHHGFSCDHGSQLRDFYIGTLVLNSLGIIILLVLLRISMQGSIRDSWPRRNISKCLYAKLFMLLPEFVWVCLSTFWAFGHDFSCDWTVVWTARGAVICSWIVGFIMFVGILIVFDPMGSVKQRRAIICSMNKGAEPEIAVNCLSAQKVWETRCRVLCCCLVCNPDTRQALADVSGIVAEFFHDVDLVPTDIAAGLVLVQQQQQNTNRQLGSVIIDGASSSGTGASSRSASAVPEPKSWMTISNMVHYMKFAMGSYGWPFYMYEHLATGVCRLCTHCRFCACIRKSNGVIADNICHCNTAAIKKLAKVADRDLIYVSFHNKFKQVPFYVVIDRARNSVVISIRGTLSFQDALADLSATGANLDIPGLKDSYCHAAMLDCSTYILQELRTLRVLDTAFAQLETEAGLVITGHSLGAGVAAILAVLLRPEYPDLICFSFSPPGGLMSPSASRYTQDFVCSVVVGEDLVPRLGMYTLVDLKVKILRSLCQCNAPKYKILATGFLRLFCCVTPSDDGETERTEMRISRSSRYSDEERVPVLQDTLKAAESQLDLIVKSPWPLHPAGQILHVVDLNEDPSTCGNKPVYAAFWSPADFFDKIVISHKMVSDHIPNVVNSALEQLSQRNYVPQIRHSKEQSC